MKTLLENTTQYMFLSFEAFVQMDNTSKLPLRDSAVCCRWGRWNLSPSVSLTRTVLSCPILSAPIGLRVVDVISLYYSAGQELTWQLLLLIASLEHLNHDRNSCSLRRGSESKGEIEIRINKSLYEILSVPFLWIFFYLQPYNYIK